MKVLVFNVKYSPNLGDGVLAECLESTLRRSGCEVETIDLAGRRAYGDAGGGRMGALAILRLLPPRLRRTAVAFVLGRKLRRLRGGWQARVEAADAVVVGGGNLFQDDDLNFPLKIAAVLECACRAERPLAVFAVGVTAHWSDRAAKLFGWLRDCRIVHISVRDRAARDNWIAHFGHRHDVEVCPDPGLLACDLPQVGEAAPALDRPLIGVCVTHPIVLRRHAAIADAQIPLLTVDEYRQLAEWLINAGCRVLLFTNGANEDQRFLDRIMQNRACAAHVATGLLVAAAPSHTPADLIGTLRRPAAIVAHRLHACIVSYSLGTPQIGLGWDRKVESFFRSVGREGFFLQGDVTPQQIGGLVLKAMDEGIDVETHGRHLGHARQAVALLVQQMRKTVCQTDAADPTNARPKAWKAPDHQDVIDGGNAQFALKRIAIEPESDREM
ncbi:polysaccharide pyruvyl transferase family protein [Chelativorans salis]|uniref:Polysaccharide pyruvyl transferase family protein n=1 Tax=Chelativorans salis TaxID=2978478 RepID=A0ABT2LLV5_9HYPH|nr:polysaccharide pyruvyl transferase family protein [Chelativorans sp. EGI FJ00035]MCT7375566.1 polysaccharide pyruvyl transferase family protein [Chelativorans sp. EGI FJ00035]